MVYWLLIMICWQNQNNEVRRVIGSCANFSSKWMEVVCLPWKSGFKILLFFPFFKKIYLSSNPNQAGIFQLVFSLSKNPCRFPLLWKNHFSKIIIAYSIFKDLFPISKYFCFVKRETTSQVIKIYFGICCGKEYFYFYKNIGLEK